MNYSGLKLFLTILLTTFLFASCQKDDIFVPDKIPDGSFQLTVCDLKGTKGESVRGVSPASIGRVSYYLIDSNGKILELPHTGVAPDLSYIRIENLRNGKYRLLVLAESDDKKYPSDVVRVLENATDNWLEFVSEPLKPLKKEYYYSDHAFTVSNGVISDTEVILTRIFGKVAVNIRTNSDLVAAMGTIRKVEIIPNADVVAYSTLNGLGMYTSPKHCDRIDVAKTLEFCYLPLPDGTSFTGQIAITALTSDGSEAISFYNFSTTIAANTLSTVTVDYKHPDDNYVGLFVPFERFNTNNSSRILQDDEPKSIFYDASKRSFNIKAPLQYGFDPDNKLYVRFYSAVGMSDVRLMWNDTSGELLEFARFDSIPPFFEAHLEHPLSKKGGMMRTADGRMVSRNAIPNLKGAGLQLSIKCNDPYWKKIQSIIPSVQVRFSSFGGNPDAPNGAPSGNWMGIRPVHIREACAVLTNLFYVASTTDFVETLKKFDGEFFGNDKKNVPASTLISQYRNNRSLNVGLVWPGGGVIGLGGGSTWGVSQSIFFNHYGDSHTAWHEISHCIGYSHDSNLTYGRFAEVHADGLYTSMARVGRLPVSYASILQSSSNPHKY